MRTRLPLGLGCLLLLSLLGCANRPSCVIDTDCPLGQVCGADQRCVARGGGEDTGAPVDATRTDSGSADAARADSGDAGSVDMGSVDTGSVDMGSVDMGSVDVGARDTGGTDVGRDAR